MKAADLILLVAAGGLAIAAFVYWKRSAPTVTTAPVPGPGGGQAVPATTVVATAAVFPPSPSGGMPGGRSGDWLRQHMAAQGG